MRSLLHYLPEAFIINLLTLLDKTMAGNRIKIAKSKAKLVTSLIEVNEITGTFQTYVDVIVFAAALGAKRKKRIPIEEISRKEPEPIPAIVLSSRVNRFIINASGR